VSHEVDRVVSRVMAECCGEAGRGGSSGSGKRGSGSGSGNARESVITVRFMNVGERVAVFPLFGGKKKERVVWESWTIRVRATALRVLFEKERKKENNLNSKMSFGGVLYHGIVN
jgi:ribosomal protein L15